MILLLYHRLNLFWNIAKLFILDLTADRFRQFLRFDANNVAASQEKYKYENSIDHKKY